MYILKDYNLIEIYLEPITFGLNCSKSKNKFSHIYHFEKKVMDYLLRRCYTKRYCRMVNLFIVFKKNSSIKVSHMFKNKMPPRGDINGTT